MTIDKESKDVDLTPHPRMLVMLGELWPVPDGNEYSVYDVPLVSS